MSPLFLLSPGASRRTVGRVSGSLLVMIIAAVVACAGGRGHDDDDSGRRGTLRQVRVSVSGLTGVGLVLRVNDQRDLSVRRNGVMVVANLRPGAEFSVIVKKQPSGQTCSVSDGEGTVDESDYTTVRVDCGDGGGSGDDAGTTDGGQDGGTTDGGQDGGTTDGGQDGGTTDGGQDGGTTDGGQDGGTTDGGQDGGTTDGGQDGGTTDGGQDGGTADGGQDGGTTDGGTSTATRVVMLGDSFFTAQSGRVRTALQTLSGATIEAFYADNAEMTSTAGTVSTIPAQFAKAAAKAGGIRTVILDGGAFDALTGGCYSPTLSNCPTLIQSEIFGAARTLFAEMKADGVVNIVFVGYYNLNIMTVDLTALVTYFADGATGVKGMKAIVEEAGGVYVDPRPLFQGNGSYVDVASYGVPTAAGAQALANLTWETMVAEGMQP